MIGDALDVVIAHLDAVDAPDEDQEDGGDAEDDSEENEGTALERYGRGFVRAGDDDMEDDDAVGDEYSGVGDEDGMAEQLAGWHRCPSLTHSNGGYVG